jgi:hypothetical protein
MDIAYFLKNCQEDIVYYTDIDYTIFLENDTHEILVENKIKEETIYAYEAYNKLDDSSVILDESEKQKLIDFIKTKL